MPDYYGYNELRAAAIADPTNENLQALADWFLMYDSNAWNGEYYDADGYELRPVCEEISDGDFEIVWWTLN